MHVLTGKRNVTVFAHVLYEFEFGPRRINVQISPLGILSEHQFGVHV